MNITWKNGKEVVMQAGGLCSTRRSERRCGEQRKNPVRDLSLVETRNSTFTASMPSGMQPACCGEVTFLRNAGIRSGYHFLPSCIPYGNDFEARSYDPALMRFTRPDPLAEKYPSLSPYAFAANNPVNAIDPTGMDWYWDTDKTRQYNPDLNKDNQAEILKKGQTYIGVTDAVKNKKGNVIEDYRADGSIMFSNETTAYNRMWSQANKVNREQMAVIDDKNVLVLPEYKNDNTTSEVEKYGYSWKDGNITDAEGNAFSTLATIHTHQDDLKGEWDFIAPPGFDDERYFPNRTPDKPYFTMGYNGKVYGEIGNYKGRQILNNIPKGYNTIDNLLKRC